MIHGIKKISEQLTIAKSQLDSSANYLNRAYAKRIINWCLDKYEPLTDKGIIETIGKVDRDFGRSITIKTKSEFKFMKSPELVKRVLQEDVSIILPETSK